METPLEFAEQVARELIEHPPEAAAVVSYCPREDRVTTNYLNCDFQKRAVLIAHMIVDLVMEIIENNAGEIREILEEEENGD